LQEQGDTIIPAAAGTYAYDYQLGCGDDGRPTELSVERYPVIAWGVTSDAWAEGWTSAYPIIPGAHQLRNACC